MSALAADREAEDERIQALADARLAQDCITKLTDLSEVA